VWLAIKNEADAISNLDVDSVNQEEDVDHDTSFKEEIIIGPPGRRFLKFVKNITGEILTT
jgi:hypothetical protein